MRMEHSFEFMLKKKFRCGRLSIKKNGVVKKLDLIYGGGTRDCSLSHIDMGFDEIHDKIRGVFSLDKSNCKSELYDFQRQKLDTNRYPTFVEYVVKNGLKFNGTLLYLCTQEDYEAAFSTPSPVRRRKPTETTENSSQRGNRTPLVEADSSTSPVIIKIEDISQTNQIPIDESLSCDHPIEILRTSSSTTSSNYSFETALNELLNLFRHLFNHHNHEQLFVQLFEHMCTMRGLASINLDRLKKEIQSIDEKQKQVYNEVLDKIEQSTRSFKALLELNRIKISHVDQHSIIMNSFNQFYQNFSILHNKWLNNSSNSEENIFHCPVTNSTDSQLSTNVSSSTSRHNSEVHLRKQARALSPSPLRSSLISSSSRHPVEHNRYKQARTRSPTFRQPLSSSSSSSSTRYYSEVKSHNRGQTQSSHHRNQSASSRNGSETNTRTQTGASSSYSRQSSSSRNFSENNSRRQDRMSPSFHHPSSSSTFRDYVQSEIRKQTRESSLPSYQRSSARNHVATNENKQPQVQSISATPLVQRSSSSSRNCSHTNSRERVQSEMQSVDRPTSNRPFTETRSRMQGRISSPSTHRSSSRISNEEEKDKSRSLFANIFQSLHYLMDILNRLRYSSFASMIYSMINEIQTCRSTIKLFDCRSLQDAEQMIISIERRLANRMRDEHHRVSPHGLDRQIEYAYNNTLDSIRYLLDSLSNFKSQIDKNKQPRKTRWSSPNPSSSVELTTIELKPTISSNQNEIIVDDDQSSEASHSSLGDEVLMEVARDAYEKRFDRHK